MTRIAYLALRWISAVSREISAVRKACNDIGKSLPKPTQIKVSQERQLNDALYSAL